MIYAGILAAGIGSRMNRQDLPKQFLPLGEKPLLINTLEQFYVNPKVERIIVVAPEHWIQFTQDLVLKYDKMNTEVVVISGGSNKTISIKMVIEYIRNTWGINDNDILVAHDGVRPFVTQRIINQNIETALEFEIAGTIIETNDTIVVSKDKSAISNIPPKREMFAEQTPQTYRLKTLEEVFKDAAEKEVNLELQTELARLCLEQGHAIHTVQGDVSNMKIINPYDLEVANALLMEKKS